MVLKKIAGWFKENENDIQNGHGGIAIERDYLNKQDIQDVFEQGAWKLHHTQDATPIASIATAHMSEEERNDFVQTLQEFGFDAQRREGIKSSSTMGENIRVTGIGAEIIGTMAKKMIADTKIKHIKESGYSKEDDVYFENQSFVDGAQNGGAINAIKNAMDTADLKNDVAAGNIYIKDAPKLKTIRKAKGTLTQKLKDIQNALSVAKPEAVVDKLGLNPINSGQIKERIRRIAGHSAEHEEKMEKNLAEAAAREAIRDAKFTNVTSSGTEKTYIVLDNMDDAQKQKIQDALETLGIKNNGPENTSAEGMNTVIKLNREDGGALKKMLQRENVQIMPAVKKTPPPPVAR